MVTFETDHCEEHEPGEANATAGDVAVEALEGDRGLL